MSDPEPFVARWSRLKGEAVKKRESDATQPDRDPEAATSATADHGAWNAQPNADEAAEPAFDPASLPSIESITAGSDIRAFLQSGVPAELTKAALRRVWTTDPAIRDFIGIAENQWDFTDPTAMPGFGPLEASDDVRALVAQAMGKLSQTSEQEVAATDHPVHGPSLPGSKLAPLTNEPVTQVAGIPERIPNNGHAKNVVEDNSGQVYVALQHADRRADNGIVPNRRAHGGALPE